MTKFVVVVLTLALIQTGLALKCYKCKDNDNKCEKTEEVICDTAPTGQTALCLTESTKNKDNNEVSTLKKCTYVGIGKKYSCITPPRQENTQCDTCDMDLCNKSAGTRMALGPMAIFALVAAFLVPKFL